MRHRKSGRKLNRSPEHRRALERNLVASFFGQFGQEKDYILTTLPKAKEYRISAEKFITLGKKARAAVLEAAENAGMSDDEVRRGWLALRRQIRNERRARDAQKAGKEFEPKDPSSEDAALAAKIKGLPEDKRSKVESLLDRALHLRRLAASRLDNEAAAKKLFEEIAPAFMDRKGGYTRVLKTSIRRLGDGAHKALLGYSAYEKPEAEEAEASA